jgi:hypothetical protein
MGKRIAFTLLALLPAVFPAHARDFVCKASPKLAGPCFTIHGVLEAANGDPTFRIWRVGTKRILGVGYGEELDAMPESLHRIELATGSAFDVRVSGNFLLCPYTRQRPGWMQFVCIEQVSNLVYQRWEGNAWRLVPQHNRR